MFTLIRNIGSAIGISALQAMTVRNASTVHSRLVEGIRPDNPALSIAAPGFDFNVPESVARMNAEITRQASMVSYIDAFWFLLIVSLAVAPMVLQMRRSEEHTSELQSQMRISYSVLCLKTHTQSHHHKQTN